MTETFPEIAVLVLAHKNLEQTSRLVAHLEKDFDVYLHIDKRSKMRISDFGTVRKTTVIKSEKTTWGSLGIVKATLKLLILASTKSHYHRYVLISGQDVPLQPNKAIISFFASFPDTDFIDTNPFLAKDEVRLSRVSRFHLFKRGPKRSRLENILADTSRRIDQILSSIGIRRSMRYQFRWGSQWMDLTSGTVKETLRFLQSDKAFIRRFRYTFCPDEVFFQTAIENSNGRRATQLPPSRFIDWTTGPEFPRVLRQSDLERLEGSPALFARKLDNDVDSEIIEALYERLAPL